MRRPGRGNRPFLLSAYSRYVFSSNQLHWYCHLCSCVDHTLADLVSISFALPLLRHRSSCSQPNIIRHMSGRGRGRGGGGPASGGHPNPAAATTYHHSNIWYIHFAPTPLLLFHVFHAISNNCLVCRLTSVTAIGRSLTKIPYPSAQRFSLRPPAAT